MVEHKSIFVFYDFLSFSFSLYIGEYISIPPLPPFPPLPPGPMAAAVVAQGGAGGSPPSPSVS